MLSTAHWFWGRKQSSRASAFSPWKNYSFWGGHGATVLSIFVTKLEDKPAHLFLLQSKQSSFLSSLCSSVPGPPSDSAALAPRQRAGVGLESMQLRQETCVKRMPAINVGLMPLKWVLMTKLCAKKGNRSSWHLIVTFGLNRPVILEKLTQEYPVSW